MNLDHTSRLNQTFMDTGPLLKKIFAGVDIRRWRFCCGFIFAAGPSVRNTKGAVGDKIQAQELETADKERGNLNSKGLSVPNIPILKIFEFKQERIISSKYSSSQDIWTGKDYHFQIFHYTRTKDTWKGKDYDFPIFWFTQIQRYGKGKDHDLQTCEYTNF